LSDGKNIKPIIKGVNLRIQECKEGIAEVINNSMLQPGEVLLILDSISTQVQMQNAAAIAAERKAYDETIEKEGEEEDGIQQANMEQ
jgi:hypothetical protein